MSVVSVVTAAAVIVVGYRLGHRPSAWRATRRRTRAARHTRPHAWLPTAQFMTVFLMLLAAMFAAAYDAGN
ncbi:hypothetical protein [Paractinoplanes abujensis]|uniref:Uncharacterized protein n=1 Tax=Paractinoplanes abujensis TaxID=882441 RepID=A0A7W7G6E9_9ACTN|nr:hypothetical protein [Actinoplanes abujensis]MBB4697524.1 hypothetical protein [Actinoplanes abujensis]